MLTGPKASVVCTNSLFKGLGLNSRVGEAKAPCVRSAPTTWKSSFSKATSVSAFSASTFSRTCVTCSWLIKAPILTPSASGLPMVTRLKAFAKALCTSSAKDSGTIMRRMAVHFCPHFTVISFLTSLTKRLNSSVPGLASSPSTDALSESASIVKGTACSTMLGCCLSFLPVAAEPVKVTTSCISMWSKMPSP